MSKTRFALDALENQVCSGCVCRSSRNLWCFANKVVKHVCDVQRERQSSKEAKKAHLACQSRPFTTFRSKEWTLHRVQFNREKSFKSCVIKFELENPILCTEISDYHNDTRHLGSFFDRFFIKFLSIFDQFFINFWSKIGPFWSNVGQLWTIFGQF